MKKTSFPAILLAAVLSCLLMCSCGPQDNKGPKIKRDDLRDTEALVFYTVSDYRSYSEEYSDLNSDEAIRALEYSAPDSYVCVLTEAADGEVKIPARHEGKSVVCLTSRSFQMTEKVTSLTVPEGISYIIGVFSLRSISEDGSAVASDEKRSFDGLTSVTLPAGAYIRYSFNDCPGLMKLTAPVLNKTVKGSFNACGLETVDIKGGASVSDSFNDCARLKSFTLNNGMLFTGSLNNCQRLSKVSLPGLRKGHFMRSFNECTALKSISLKYADLIYDSFCSCTAMKNVDILLQNTTSGSTMDHSFNDCSAISSVSINGGALSCYYSFNDSRSITALSIEGSKAVFAFKDCTSIKDLTINNAFGLSDMFNSMPELEDVKLVGIKGIVSGCFNSCGSLRTVYIEGDGTGDNELKIDRSFCKNSSLEKAEINCKAVHKTQSFTDCPKLSGTG